jgi:voltage-gated potassium channel Kch
MGDSTAEVRKRENITHWAELKFGLRLKKAAQRARERVNQRHPETEKDRQYEAKRHHVFQTLSEPGYSKFAAVFAICLGLAIVISTAFFVIETMPALGRDPWWRQTFFYAELFFVIIFSIEISLRFWSTPQSTKEFLMDFMNVIDLLSILPFYFELGVVLFTGSKSTAGVDLRFLRAFRLTRMLKMGRFSGELQLLAEGLVRARVSIAMLMGTLILGMVFFATIMWLIERGIWHPNLQCFARVDDPNYNGCSPFESVPAGFWWGITTMTTVGYGDTFPITNWGRFVGGIAMLAGIFCVALPTGILCTEFSQLYHERSTASKHAHLSKQLTRRPKHELELYLNSKYLTELRNDVNDAMTYLKRLSVVYIEETGTVAQLDPIYGTFQGQSVEAINSIRLYVQEITDEIVLHVQKEEDLPGFELNRPRGDDTVSDGPTPRY